MKKSIVILLLVLCMSLLLMSCEPITDLGEGPKETDSQEVQSGETDPADTSDPSNEEKETTGGKFEINETDDPDDWSDPHPLG